MINNIKTIVYHRTLAAILCDNQNIKNDNEKKHICIDNFNDTYISILWN